MKTTSEQKRILTKAKNGDRDAMAELIENNRDNVFALAYRMTGNRDDALDITQETFVKAIENIRNFKGKSTIATWLYSIAANLSRDYLRKRIRRDSVSLDEAGLSDKSDSPIDTIDEDERKKLVRRAIAELPPATRAAFVLRYDRNLPIAEIAGVLRKSEGTIKAQLFEAVKRIRTILKIEE